ncbi:putative elongator complex protein 1 [Rhopilema esculentum]|uniref:putative elongator complex protein 1 n=1 Tax=Rhopilema esculentum TaxID=499914 RepID=UPI0031D7AD32|eukprot:gene6010-11379_t
MRSLELISVDSLKIDVDEKIKWFCVDSLSQKAFFSTNNEVFSFLLQQKKVENSVKIDQQNVLSIEYLMDDETISIASSNGDLFEWRMVDQSLECVGTMESGITCMKWSPDQEIFALTTGDEKLVLMSRDLEPFFETDLNPEEFGEAQLITVGWGSKKTQFHGTEGKPTAMDLKPKVPDPALPWDDKKVRISWCDDGQYFAVSSVDPITGSRKVRVRSREGALHSTNEVVPGLEHPLHWRPCGNLIASSQRKPNKHDVIFFEKNGLKHGEFTLPFKPKEAKVIELCWNKTSDILAVWLEELHYDQNTPQPQQLSYLQLWTRNNYHWYLKQEYRFSSMGRRISSLIWDADSPLKLHVVCEDGFYYQLTLRWTVLQNKDSCVAVIDGSNLLLTPFATAVVPPPMSLMKATFKAPVNQVCFGKSPNEATVFLSDGSTHCITIPVSETEEQIDSKAIKIVRHADVANSLEDELSGYLHVTSWVDGGYVAVCRMKNQKQALCHVANDDDTAQAFVIRKVIPMDLEVLAVAVGKDCAAVEMQDGTVFSCERDDGSFAIKPWVTPFGSSLCFPVPCDYIAVCKVNHEDIVIGMTNHYRLYVNEKQVADNCTSFSIHDEYLAYTTHNHLLRCLRLDSILKFVNSSDKEQLQGEDFSRSLERGSRIISAVFNDTKVVLQMPRGNLETIHPRALVISFLKKQLDKLLYREALLLMKRHRINLNLIYDHNPKLFLDNVDTFITNVKSENDINLFLAELGKEDVTQSLYATSYHVTTKNATENINKVDVICSAVRNAIVKIGVKSFFLSYLTTYAKESKPGLGVVLSYIKSLKDKKIEADVTHERALRHILYFADVNELYDVALGLYDFEIVLMVAEKSNKDPKEYLPFLNELKKYEKFYCQFKIDCHLKRYTKALGNIHACGPSRFEEFLDFTAKHNLYKDALLFCREDPFSFKEVSAVYGSYLVQKKRYNEAGIVYSRVSLHEEAKDSFVKSHNWKLAIAEAEMLNYSNDALVQFAVSLAGEMQELKNWKESGNILELYTEDYESAISAYLSGNMWQDALRVIYKARRKDIIETNFKTALEEAYKHQLEVIHTAKENFIKYKERLAVVRALKEKQHQEVADGLREEVENDLFSEASSVTGQSDISATSKGSRASGHSSKSRRKYQRKKYSLKEGSKFEDFALVEALAEIVNTVDHLQEGTASLLEMLTLFMRDGDAASLQAAYDTIFSLIKRSMKEIWSPSQSQEAIVPFGTGPDSTVNSIIAGMKTPKQLEQNSAAGLPEPTRPVLRENVTWKLEML